MPTAARSISILARVLILLPLLISPWLHGGVSYYVHAAVCVCLLVGTGLTLLSRDLRAWHPTKLQLFVIPVFALTALQLVPLPAEISNRLSPKISEYRAEFDTGDKVCLSLAPEESRFAISKVWLAFAAIILGSRLFRDESGIRFLLSAIAINGTLIAGVGIVQRMGGFPELFWPEPTEITGLGPFGPFYNRNNAAGYLVCCLPAALSLLAVQNLSGTSSRLAAMPGINLQFLTSLAIAATTSGILLTLCRGSYVALVGCALVVLVFRFKNQTSRRFVVSQLLAISAVVIYFVAIYSSSAIGDRIREINPEDASDLILHWKDDLRMALDHWATGCGLGVYQFANRAYQSAGGVKWFAYSENQYLEILISLGVLGLASLLVFQFSLLAKAYRLFSQPVPSLRILGVFGILVVVANSITAFFDFGFFHSSNLLLLAIQVGAIIQAESLIRPSKPKASVGTILMILLFCGGIFSVNVAFNHCGVAAAIDESFVEESLSDHPPSSLQLESQTRKLEKAVAKCPNHSKGNRHISRLYTSRFRYSLLDDLTSTTQLPPQKLWKFTSPEFIAKRLGTLQLDNPENFHQANLPGETADVEQASKYINQAIRSCPLDPKAYIQRARVNLLLQKPELVLADLEKCLRLAPIHPALHATAANIAVSINETDKAKEWLTRALVLGQPLDRNVTEFLAANWTASEFVSEIPEEDQEVLMKLIRAGQLESPWRDAAGTRIVELWNGVSGKERLEEDECTLGCFAAEVYASNGQINASFDCYEQVFAGRMSPKLVASRFRYAKQLEKAGNTGEAIRQAGICCHQSSDPVYERWRNELITERFEKK